MGTKKEKTGNEKNLTEKTGKKKANWKLIAGLILIVQLLFGIVLLGIVLWLNVLPIAYVVLIGGILLWLVSVVYYFFYSGVAKKKQKKLSREQKRQRVYIKRGAGCTISALVMVLCVAVSSMLVQAGNTLQKIADTDVMTDTVSVYVLKENPANDMLDAKDYTFAITENFDYEHTQTAVEEINAQVGQSVQTQSFETIFDMVDALYDGTVGAMVLNVAYVDLIESQDEYDSFSEKTRTLFAHETETVVQESSETLEKDITKDSFVVYISGSDTRSSGLNGNTRSDVNILVVVNPTTKQVLLINTPRDYYIDITASPGAKDKLTHCGVYGIDCSMDTLSNLYDEHVDYYAKINFSGFETLIDAIGGITIESEKSFCTSEGGYYISQGTNQLNGAVALSYVRERKAFADGDNARGRHQMQAIEAIIRKVSSGTTILSNYSDILSSLEGMFTTNMSQAEISALVRMQLSDGAGWNVKSFAVNGKGSKQHVYSMPGKRTYVTIPDETTVSYAKLLIDKTIDGVILTDEDMVQPAYVDTVN